MITGANTFFGCVIIEHQCKQMCCYTEINLTVIAIDFPLNNVARAAFCHLFEPNKHKTTII